MKRFSKTAIVLLSLMACITFSCKKELTVSKKNVALTSSSVYGQVTTVATGLSGRAIAVDAAHNIYIGNSQIYKLTPGGVITLLAGSPNSGSNDGTGANAQFGGLIFCMTFGPDSALYAADTFNNLIRKITLSGVVTTVAGRPGVYGHKDGAAAQATFSFPTGIASCTEGNLYVSDYFDQGENDNNVRVITPGGTVYTLFDPENAGYHPWGIATYQGNVYFSNDDPDIIYKIGLDGTLNPFANVPLSALVIDSSGNLYASVINYNVIRKITPSGVVSDVAGNGLPGFSDGVGANAQFNGPYGIAIDGDYLYVADTNNGEIRKVAIK